MPLVRCCLVAGWPVYRFGVGRLQISRFEVARFSSPSISTVQVDPWEIGLKTAQLTKQLLNLSQEDDAHTAIDEVLDINIPISLIFRESTA